ncbi:hypothetical protein D3C86_1433760 [compost metagenome]
MEAGAREVARRAHGVEVALRARGHAQTGRPGDRKTEGRQHRVAFAAHGIELVDLVGGGELGEPQGRSGGLEGGQGLEEDGAPLGPAREAVGGQHHPAHLRDRPGQGHVLGRLAGRLVEGHVDPHRPRPVRVQAIQEGREAPAVPGHLAVAHERRLVDGDDRHVGRRCERASQAQASHQRGSLGRIQHAGGRRPRKGEDDAGGGDEWLKTANQWRILAPSLIPASPPPHQGSEVRRAKDSAARARRLAGIRARCARQSCSEHKRRRLAGHGKGRVGFDPPGPSRVK